MIQMKAVWSWDELEAPKPIVMCETSMARKFEPAPITANTPAITQIKPRVSGDGHHCIRPIKRTGNAAATRDVNPSRTSQIAPRGGRLEGIPFTKALDASDSIS